MNAPSKIEKPAKTSLVAECWDCEGEGSHFISDGDANPAFGRDVNCDTCDSTGHLACEVCGNEFYHKGYDCVVCEFVGEAVFAGITAEQAEILHSCVGETLTLAAQKSVVGMAA